LEVAFFVGVYGSTGFHPATKMEEEMEKNEKIT
jgi:hypothetical protein